MQSDRRPNGPAVIRVLAILAVLAAPVADFGADWTFWRGPDQQGRSDETGLISTWSPGGENLLWHAEFIGRSTPVVVDGRVCAIGRYGKKETVEQLERVSCFDAASGALLWDHRYPVYNTTVAFNRTGWASLAADDETGYVYSHGASGPLRAYDAEGNVVWGYELFEWNGRASGYGGRTQTPIVWRDMLLIGFVSQGWGDQAAPRHRYFAFDKYNGDLLWVSTPGEMVKDRNTQGGPVVADIDGRKLLISGNADGWVYALDVFTGEPVWKFHLSKRGINVTPVVANNTVYISHSEENVDTPNMGRVVAIDATGSGDITATGEKWRVDELQAGFPSPAYNDGVVYLIDNSANLHAYDAASGKQHWIHNVGTVGKASPLVADGKLYITEVNGRFYIVKPGEDGCENLDLDELHVEEGRYAEIYGSPAVADGRIYFAAESGIYALGDGNVKPKVAKSKKAKKRKSKPGKGQAAALLVVPAEVILRPNETARFSVRAIDAAGNPVAVPEGSWSLKGLSGAVTDGIYKPAGDGGSRGGTVTFAAGELSGTARLRVIEDLPWRDGFDSYEADSVPITWIQARGNFKVGELEGEPVLVQPAPGRGVQRRNTMFGLSDWNNYSIQIDFYGTPFRRRRPDVGVVAAGYTLDLQGVKQQLEIRSWAAELRMARQVPFAWEMETWYTMKLSVTADEEKAVVRGKVWKRGDAEPEDWTLTVEDPFPVTAGSAGIVGYAPAPVYYDNLMIWKNEE